MDWLYDELKDNEEVIFHTRSHRIIFLKALPILMAWIDLLFLYAGILFLIYATGTYFYYEYVITNRRVIIKKGFFDIRIDDIPLHRVEDVLIRRSLYDKIIRGGTVFIFGESIPIKKLSGMDKPTTFRNALFSQLPTSTIGYFQRA